MSSSTTHAPFTYEHYRHILRSAQENGYEFISFPRLKDYRQNEQRVCLLRHDCDNDLTAAAKLARIEEEMGVRSTYFLMLRSAMYNLLSLPNAELVREIIGRGHWIGLHFDEVPYANATPERIKEYVDEERARVSTEFGAPVDVVSFHQPSARVLQNELKLNCINTYNREDVEGAYYLSDSNTVLKEGCPSNLFKAAVHTRLQLLLHPEWWTEKEMPLQEKWNEMLRHNFELMQQSLLSREAAYLERQEIKFG
ncbi:MAG TPA: hypothetical protein VJT71_13160 [Pyrinomonadaceae bacterium]|nr:hypothetical protein [Pyrinomonadaceae bacterium]